MYVHVFNGYFREIWNHTVINHITCSISSKHYKNTYAQMYRLSTEVKGIAQLQAMGRFALISWYELCSLLKALLWLKYRTSIKGMFLYLNLRLSVMLDSLSCSFTSIAFLNNCRITLRIRSARFPYHTIFVSFTVTRRVTLVEQELLLIPEHLSSPSIVSCVRVAQFLV